MTLDIWSVSSLLLESGLEHQRTAVDSNDTYSHDIDQDRPFTAHAHPE